MPSPTFGYSAPMTRQDNYADAHRRHLKDANLLFCKARWPNADHLYGLSAECGLKVVIKTLVGQVPKEYRKHVNKLWPIYCTLIEGRGETRYLMDGEPFRDWKDWKMEDRYAHCGHVDRERAQRHREGAEEVRHMLENVAVDGRP